MRLFGKLYNRAICWSKHPHAKYYLAGLSVTEAVFLPIPPDVMLAPMVLAEPDKAWGYALLTTLTSTLGGVFGYLLGFFFFTAIKPAIAYLGYMDAYIHVQQFFTRWGFLAMFIAAFTPIPFKVFTITAGASVMPFFPFFMGSIIGRAARFYLVVAIMKWGGKRIEKALIRYVEWIGWFLVFLMVVYFVWRQL